MSRRQRRGAKVKNEIGTPSANTAIGIRTDITVPSNKRPAIALIPAANTPCENPIKADAVPATSGCGANAPAIPRATMKPIAKPMAPNSTIKTGIVAAPAAPIPAIATLITATALAAAKNMRRWSSRRANEPAKKEPAARLPEIAVNTKPKFDGAIPNTSTNMNAPAEMNVNMLPNMKQMLVV